MKLKRKGRRMITSSYAITKEDAKILEELTEKLGFESKSGVIRLALRVLYELYKQGRVKPAKPLEVDLEGFGHEQEG